MSLQFTLQSFAKSRYRMKCHGMGRNLVLDTWTAVRRQRRRASRTGAVDGLYTRDVTRAVLVVEERSCRGPDCPTLNLTFLLYLAEICWSALMKNGASRVYIITLRDRPNSVASTKTGARRRKHRRL